MKNKFLFVCLAGTAIFFVSLFSFGGFRAVKGDYVTAYNRFWSLDSTGKHFNWKGLISPIQLESQQVVADTMVFNRRVYYPYGENFQCVSPIDDSGEKFIASEIMRIVNDSLNALKIKSGFNYDGTNLAVRNAANPELRPRKDPQVFIRLFGTASPEASRYGPESILPGHIEYENEVLAQLRTNRTASLVSENGYQIVGKDFAEVQFPDTLSAISANKAALDTMRYVDAQVLIAGEKIEVTPTTSPVLFPVWWIALTFLLLFLRQIRIKKPQLGKFNFTGFWPGIWEFLKILVLAFGLTILLTLLIFLLRDFLYVLLVLLLLAVCGYFLYLLYKYRKETWVIILVLWTLLKWLFKKLIEIFKAILYVIALIIILLIFLLFAAIEYIWNWWKTRTTCQKILFFMTLYALFATYMWLSCPC